MKKIAAILIALSVVFFSSASLGHSGHGHDPINASKAISKAKSVVLKLVNKGTLDLTWKDAKSYDVKKKKSSKAEEWLITVKNANTSKNTTLYVFLSLSGEYLAANFTGK